MMLPKDFFKNIRHLNFLLLFCIILIAGIGFIMLYGASGGFNPWAIPQIMHFFLGFLLMMAIALIPVRYWLKYAYTLYCASLVSLICVCISGHTGMGAQRWLDLYFIKVQPSEIMRIALILSLSCYFHRSSLTDVRRPTFLIVPLLMVFAPFFLILKQPDLGTALLLLGTSVSIIFLVGAPLRYFIGAAIMSIGAIPVAWSLLHTYQKNRVLTFLDPERDPLGAGYHIIQSKIALGSGGIFGKGFLKGTQSHLQFLPEKQTDFIFTMLCEECGLFGASILIILYLLLILIGSTIALKCQNTFSKLVSAGITLSFFFYVFINMAMVTGLLPVVGVPLPLISYGGTAMLTILIGFGFLLNADLHQDLRLERYH